MHAERVCTKQDVHDDDRIRTRGVGAVVEAVGPACQVCKQNKTKVRSILHEAFHNYCRIQDTLESLDLLMFRKLLV